LVFLAIAGPALIATAARAMLLRDSRQGILDHETPGGETGPQADCSAAAAREAAPRACRRPPCAEGVTTAVALKRHAACGGGRRARR
jgi:hypothetical protein